MHEQIAPVIDPFPLVICSFRLFCGFLGEVILWACFLEHDNIIKIGHFLIQNPIILSDYNY